MAFFGLQSTRECPCDPRLDRRNSDTLSESRKRDTNSSGRTSHYHLKTWILRHGKRALEGLKTTGTISTRCRKRCGKVRPIIDGAVAKLSAELAKVNALPATATMPLAIEMTPMVNRPAPIPMDSQTGLITGPEQRILNAIARFESIGIMEPEQTAVAFLAGYTYGGGGYPLSPVGWCSPDIP